MSLTPEQTASAEAWATVFADNVATTRVLDDMTAFAYGLTPDQQVGATRLLLYLLTKRSQLRRASTAARRGAKTT